VVAQVLFSIDRAWLPATNPRPNGKAMTSPCLTLRLNALLLNAGLDVPLFVSGVRDICAIHTPHASQNIFAGRASRRYGLIFAIALLTGLMATLITYCSRFLTQRKLNTCYALIDKEVANQTFPGAAFMVFSSINLGCAVVAALLVVCQHTSVAFLCTLRSPCCVLTFWRVLLFRYIVSRLRVAVGFQK